MDNNKKKISLAEKFGEKPVILITIVILLTNLALAALDHDAIIMKKLLFFFNDNFYLEYIVKFIRVLIFFIGLTIYFIEVAFFYKDKESKRNTIILGGFLLILVIGSGFFSINYVKDVETVKNNRYETCIVKNSNVEISKARRGKYYYVTITDSKKLIITFEQYRSVKDKNPNQKVRVYYLKNSETVLKIESYS